MIIKLVLDEQVLEPHMMDESYRSNDDTDNNDVWLALDRQQRNHIKLLKCLEKGQDSTVFRL